MKSLKNVFIGVLALIGLVLAVRNVVLPLVNKGSVARKRAAGPALPAAAQTAPAGTANSSNSNSPAGSAAISASAGTRNRSGSPAVMDLGVVQTNWVRWTESPPHDPFQMTSEGANRPAGFRTAMEILTLNSILYQSGGPLAVIDNRVVMRGDMVLGYKVLNIGSEHVWLEGPNGFEELIFDYAGSLRSNLLKSGRGVDAPLVGQEARLDWPHRVVDGVTNNIASDRGWFPFSGKVLQKLGTGAYLILAVTNSEAPSPVMPGQQFIVKNVPLALADNESLPMIQCKYTGVESLQERTFRVFDFGVICAPRKDAGEALEAHRRFLLQRYAAANERRVGFDRASAERGSAGAQLILGRRYLDGEGVPKDIQEARKWLEKSAAQGNSDATAMLGSLTPPVGGK